MNYTLIDDGTLDTVVKCGECGYEMRYSQEVATLYRDEKSGVLDFDSFCREVVYPDHVESGECDEEREFAEEMREYYEQEEQGQS